MISPNNRLAPSLLAANFANLGKDIKALETAGVSTLHLDVMDGNFVKNISFGLPVIESIRPLTNMTFDLHLMIKKPSKYIQRFADAGADIITFHLEIDENIRKNIELVKSTGKKVGLAINPSLDVDWLYHYVKHIDQVTIMTVPAGFGGQEFMPQMLDKVKEIKTYLNKKDLNVDIQVDGGINLSNVQSTLDAGANVIVAGSSVFKGGDIPGAVASFNNILQA